MVMVEMPEGFTDTVVNVEGGYDTWSGEIVEIWVDATDRDPLLLDKLFARDADADLCECGAYMLPEGSVEYCAGKFCPRCAKDIPWCCHDHFGEDRD